ncbi:CvfD/Ygs/GSP13 family RNA-binding post-transcriptional regulator [Anaerorhabdus sp.]|jgi:general stress protein 13|uniref:CvfD/Ygs/GSP13 family RNA-binding post-transcriptional regulator n=1 Tax=Anaerorhabdus sp. TaxID=1872524 RepID=UPI002FCB1978
MQYQIGQIVEGKITGIQPYGAFVSLDENTKGLVHISEISDGYVKDVANFVSLNDTVCFKIIDFDEKTHQARLSLKAIQPNRFRRERKHQKMGALPTMKIGFKSISEKMDQWIIEAKAMEGKE